MDETQVQFFCVLCVCTYCPQVAKFPAHPQLSNVSTCPVRPPAVEPPPLALDGPAGEAQEWNVTLWAMVAVFLVMLLAVGRFLKLYWWDLLVLKAELERKGVLGPPFRFLVGNLGEMSGMARKAQEKPMAEISHDIVPRVFPYYREWAKLYGKPFLVFVGPQPTLVTSDPVLLDAIFKTKPGQLHNSWLQRVYVKMTLGEAGLVLAEGESWKSWTDRAGVVTDALNSDRVDAIVKTMVKGVKGELFQDWDKELRHSEDHTFEIDICKKVSKLTTKALSLTAFSSSHRKQGKKVFKKQMELMEIQTELSQRRVWIPGCFPSRRQRRMLKLRRRIESTLREIVTERVSSIRAGGKAFPSYGNDLLGHILSNAKGRKLDWDVEQIVDHCRDFFFAGYETSAIMLSWTLMLLGHYTKWQDRARAEILDLCGDDAPEAAQLSEMKVLGMVLKESLRLYPPSAVLSREIQKQATLNGLEVPKGLATFTLVLQLHREPGIWGDDALEFKPERFADGLPEGLHPLGYLPFSSGRLVSVGQAYAVLEAKVVLAMFLQRYIFHLSPKYKHCPNTLALRPEHGVPLILRKRLRDYPDP